MTKKEFVSLLGGAGPRRYGENRDPCKSHDGAGNT